MHIDDRTKVSMYVVLSCIPFLVGGVIWLTTIDTKASAAQDELVSVKALLLDVRERVIRIEAQGKHR